MLSTRHPAASTARPAGLLAVALALAAHCSRPAARNGSDVPNTPPAEPQADPPRSTDDAAPADAPPPPGTEPSDARTMPDGERWPDLLDQAAATTARLGLPIAREDVRIVGDDSPERMELGRSESLDEGDRSLIALWHSVRGDFEARNRLPSRGVAGALERTDPDGTLHQDDRTLALIPYLEILSPLSTGVLTVTFYRETSGDRWFRVAGGCVAYEDRLYGPFPQGRAASPEPPAEVPVTLRIRLGDGAERYVGYARYWTEQLTLERKAGAAWEPVAYEAGLCTEPCPEDGSPPTCRFCSPPTPSPSYRAVSGLGPYEWPGIVYLGRSGPQPSCFCHLATAAPHGRYRATLCSRPEVRCERDDCRVAAGEEGFGSAIGEERCDGVEFDYAGEPLEVELVVGASGPAGG